MIDPLFPFVFAGLFSPGPNVVMLTASGARFGFRSTLPHLLGVVLGVGVIAGAAALGVSAALAARPGLELLLKGIAMGWIFWMAWRLWQSSAQPRDPDARPMRFHEAVLFQWVNPKIWAVALAASAGYPGGLPPMAEALRLGLTFSGTNLFVCLFWTAAGSLLRTLLAEPQAWRRFARIMAVFLAASAFL